MASNKSSKNEVCELLRIGCFSLLAFILLLTSCKNNAQKEGKEEVASTPKTSQEVQNNYYEPPVVDEEFMADSVLVTDRKIIFDDDFRPSVTLTIKNKMKYSIKALQIIVDPNVGGRKNCEPIYVTKKVVIPSGKSVVVSEKIGVIDGTLCPIDQALIQLGQFVLENGKKTTLQMLWWESVSRH